ncbi:MAG: DNA-binding protein [Bacilli bacterium]|nr:DNA-binding protein [Bacilli bacterium]
MKERLYLINLYDLYGNLLTSKQQTYFEEYYFNNLSLSEMSELYDVSRSAVSKALKEIETKLNNYEDKLKIYNKLNKVNKLIKDDKLKNKIDDIFKD